MGRTKHKTLPTRANNQPIILDQNTYNISLFDNLWCMEWIHARRVIGSTQHSPYQKDQKTNPQHNTQPRIIFLYSTNCNIWRGYMQDEPWVVPNVPSTNKVKEPAHNLRHIHIHYISTQYIMVYRVHMCKTLHVSYSTCTLPKRSKNQATTLYPTTYNICLLDQLCYKECLHARRVMSYTKHAPYQQDKRTNPQPYT